MKRAIPYLICCIALALLVVAGCAKKVPAPATTTTVATTEGTKTTPAANTAEGKNTEAYAALAAKIPAEAKTVANPVKADAMVLANGKTIYDQRCAGCHGENGDGNSPKASAMSPSPPGFSDKEAMSKLTDGALFWVITNGATPMPGFAKVAETDRWAVIDYIRTFSEQATADGTKG